MIFEDKSVLIWGSGESGKACKKLLEENGAITNMISKNDEAQFDWNQHFDYVFLSPGVPVLNNNQNLSSLAQNGAIILGETELGFMFSKSKICAITGTNGKTTTTTLLSKIFIEDEKNTFLCGNVGTPLSLVAKDTTEESVICLEISSYQLETIKNFHAHVACVLNIAPDHLARHLTMSNYIKAKERIFLNQTEDDFAVLNFLDPEVIRMQHLTRAKKVWFSSESICDGAYVSDGWVCFKGEYIVEVSQIRLLGKKNLENVLAAVAIAKTQNVKTISIIRAIENFEPIEHRIQKVGEFKGVSFINDSKATNVASTLTALDAIKDNLILLLGGSDKGEDFLPLAGGIGKNVEYCIVYGATKQKIVASLSKSYEKFKLIEAENFKDAFIIATKIAKKGDCVLLSPACASFDEFQNFEERGRTFCELVKKWGEG